MEAAKRQAEFAGIRGVYYLAKIGATSADGQRPIRYLQAAYYITYLSNGNLPHISVAAKGADRARELDGRIGR